MYSFLYSDCGYILNMLELTDASCLLKLSFGIDRIFVGGKSRRGAGGARGDRALSQDFHSTFNEVFCKISLLLNQLNDIQFSDRADQVKKMYLQKQ